MTGTAPSLPVLTDEQRVVTDALARGTRTKPVQTLGGYAGTGKTTVIAHLMRRLSSFGVCAYTGKAADILKRKGLPASTIHSLIYKPVDVMGRLTFVRKALHEVGVCGFIIDEGSMVGRDVMADLKSFGQPIIVVGDHGQLPPVGEDAGLMMNPDYKLETIHRNAGPIARFAEYVRKGGVAKAWRDPGGDGPGAVYVMSKEAVDDGRLLRSDQLICAFNKTRVGLNRTLRRLNNRDGTDTPVPGDRVMCLRNDRAAGVFNGQQGIIQRIDYPNRLMQFAPTYGSPLWVGYHPDAWNADRAPPYDRSGAPGMNVPFDFCWAVTAHKSQGDEWGKVLVFEERCSKWEHARWAYTSASRAKQALLWGHD